MLKVTHSMRIIIEKSMIRSEEEDFIEIKPVEITYFVDQNDHWNMDDQI